MRLRVVVSIGLLVAGAAACAGCKSAAKVPPAVIVGAETGEAPGSAAAAMGQEVVVTLTGNAGTGYSWSCTPPAGVRLLSTKAAATGDVPMAGSPTTWTFRLVADAPGEHAVRFDYTRPWEQNAAPARTYMLTLNAD